MAPQHILIVEDEPNTAEMLTSYFAAQGYETTSVAWGKDALAFIERVLPDLVVLDIRLPDIDGYEICRRLRSQRRTAQVPIIFLSKKGERSDRLTGLELGAVDYVTKPFDIQELRLRVRNILHRVHARPLAHPVTGLPYSVLAEEQFQRLSKKKHGAVVAIALGELEAFAETYGFVAQDDVLRAVALMVQNIADEDGGKEPFVGQLGDNVLFVITTASRAGKVRDRLATRLGETMAFFYPRTDWETGQDHSGNPVPRLTVHLGLVNDSVSYQDGNDLREALLQSLVRIL